MWPDGLQWLSSWFCDIVYSACPLPHPLEAETVCWIQPARGLSQTWIIVLFVEEDKPVNHLGLPNLCS